MSDVLKCHRHQTSLSTLSAHRQAINPSPNQPMIKTGNQTTQIDTQTALKGSQISLLGRKAELFS